MEKLKKAVLKVLLKIVAIVFSLFVVTFVVYFFNLDMKLTAAMEPILFKFYDKVKRDQHL
jgi:ABC-type phosphate transport system permease subunit